MVLMRREKPCLYLQNMVRSLSILNFRQFYLITNVGTSECRTNSIRPKYNLKKGTNAIRPCCKTFFTYYFIKYKYSNKLQN